MLRTFQFRLYPNTTQRTALDRILVDNCETYNAALQERRDAWKLQRKRISLYDQFKELSELRRDMLFRLISCDIMRDPIRRVDRAFKAFFRRCKEGEKPGYPRFKSRHRYDSLAFGSHHLVVREKSVRVPNVGEIGEYPLDTEL